jgi:hypothetical protein
MIVLLKQDVEQMAKDIVRQNISLNLFFKNFDLVWRIHELAEPDFEQGRFRRRRYRQQMRQLQMQPSPYEPPSIYPPSSYYMCSPPPPSYHSMYPTENYSMNSPDSSPSNYCMTSSTPTSYPFYDPYYSTGYHPPTNLSYTNPNESNYFDA